MQSNLYKKLGLICIENFTPQEMLEKIMAKVKPELVREDWFKNFVNGHLFLPGVDYLKVWEYLGNPENMQEWTISLREIEVSQKEGQKISFKGKDCLFAGQQVYGELVIDSCAFTIDLSLGADPEDLWLCQSLRIMDAFESMEKMGTIITWILYRHEKYDLLPKYRDIWAYQPAVTEVTGENLSKILIFKYQ